MSFVRALPRWLGQLCLSSGSKYLVTAGVTGPAYWIPYYLLTEHGLYYLLSSFVGTLIQAPFKYVLKRGWVFRTETSTEIKVQPQALSYLISEVAVFGCNLVGLAVLHRQYHMGYLWAQAIVTVVLGVLCFLYYRSVIFAPRFQRIISLFRFSKASV